MTVINPALHQPVDFAYKYLHGMYRINRDMFVPVLRPIYRELVKKLGTDGLPKDTVSVLEFLAGDDSKEDAFLFHNFLCNIAHDPKMDPLKKLFPEKHQFFLKMLREDGGARNMLIFSAYLQKKELPAFMFENSTVVQDILESRVSKVPMAMMKFPFKNMVIGLPERVKYPDLSDDYFDVILASDTVTYSLQSLLEKDSKPSDTSSDSVILLFMDSHNIDHVAYMNMPYSQLTVVENDEIINPSKPIPEDSVNMSKAVMMFLKLLMFINSQQCEIRTVQRPKKKKAFTSQIVPRYSEVKVLRFKGPRYISNYDEVRAVNKRTFSTRFPVVGHFKHFTKGKMAGRIIWCPPFWKGPLAGPASDRAYVVGGAK